MSDDYTPQHFIQPGEEDPLYEQMDDDTPAEQDEQTARILVPRTVVTARAWLEQRTEAARILSLPDVVQVRAAMRSHFRCLGCGDELPAWRGSWCDACTEWRD